ncbi:vacuolar protein sorting 37B [Arctopsyche grandis]|uniref:vacuolar protein sorting 37B n=1 Tax=Arctopsyche grandis TaxID=121162 RepID=UPI00406D9FB7
MEALTGLLSHLTNDELKDVLNDEDKAESIFKDIQQVKDMEAEKDVIIASNRSLAEFNLSKESTLNDSKQIILDRSAVGEELCKSIQSKLDVYKSKCSGISLDTTLALLEAAAAESEESSEDIAQKFLSGDIDIEKFLEDFSKERIIMHLRKVKIDKMSELIKQSQNPQPGGLFGYSPQRLPYPQYPTNIAMPMPGSNPNYFY